MHRSTHPIKQNLVDTSIATFVWWAKLLSEEAAEEIAERTEDGEESSAWTCLQCGKGVKSAEREEEGIVVLDVIKAGKDNEASK